MKPAISWLEYQQLELIIPEQVENCCRPTLRSRLSNLWNSLVAHLTKPSELQIWHTCDNTGKLWWSVFDPETGRSLLHVSEHQIRVWIEQRY